MQRNPAMSIVLACVLASSLYAQPPLPPPPPLAPGVGPRATVAEPPGIVARFGAAYFRHDYAVAAIAFSGDGKRMAVVSQDGRIRIWDTNTAKELVVIAAPIQGGSAHRITFSKGDKEIYALGRDGSIHTLNAGTGLESHDHAPLARSASLNALGWAPEAKRVLYSDNTGTLRLLNATEKSEIRTWKAHPYLAMSVALSQDAKLAASIGQEGRAMLWDVDNGKEARVLEPSPLQRNLASTASFLFSPDGKLLVQGSYDRTIPVWDTATGKIVRKLEVPLNVNGAFSLTISPDGKYFAARMTDRTIRVWGLASGLELRCFDASGNHYEPLAFSHDSLWLAAGHGPSVRLWNVRTARERFPSEGHNGPVSGLMFLDNGKLLASCGGDATLRIWDLAAKKELARTGIQSSFLNPIAPLEHPRSLEVFGYNTSMALKVTNRSLVTEETRSFSSISGPRCVSPDGRWLAFTPNQGVGLFDIKAGRVARTLAAQRGYLQIVQFSPDGRLLAAWVQPERNGQQGLRIWETAGGRQLPQRLPAEVGTGPVRHIAFSHEGRLIAILDYNNALHIVETATGALRHSFSMPPESPLATMMFSRDGTAVFLGLANGQLLIRNLVHGAQNGPFRAHISQLQVFSISRDGKLLATGGADATIVLYATEALAPPPRPAGPASVENLDRWWQDLGSADGTRVALALSSLRSHPEAAAALIRERFRPDAPPPKPPEAEQLAKWIAGLDDERFAIREQSYRALSNAAEAARAALQSTLDNNPSDEVRRRATNLLRALSGPIPPSKLRPYRILELLEQLDATHARPLLAEVAQKAADPEFREEAARISERLDPKK